MYYGQLIKDCTSDGPGVRISLYVSGCRNHCKGCHNLQSQDFKFGNLFGEDVIKEILKEISKPYIRGLTLCGGDPMEKENRAELLPFLKMIKKQFPEKDIWCYTGYTWNEVKDFEIIKYIDVLVDGPFIISKRDTTINNLWRGSTNQKVIDVKASLNNNRQINLKDIPNND